MIFQVFSFYMFSSIIIVAAVMVISARNPVHSVLFLILAFFNSAGLFVLLGAEFLAMLMVIVYVGAVAVLFMFVVMMLDISPLEMREGFLQYLPLGALVGFVLILELGVVAGSWTFISDIQNNVVAPINTIQLTNTEAIGGMIYTHYVYYFEAAGMILLVAMVGAIVLTHRTRSGVHKQNIARQVTHHPSDTIEIKKVSSGSGI
jgi:NADH-quinone oxidoreductase subunit J